MWERVQEFDDSHKQKKIFSDKNIEEPPARANVESQGTPQLGEKTSQKALENLHNGYKNLLGLFTPIEHIVEENPKTPVRKLSEPRVSSPLLARRRSSWMAIEQQKNLMGLSETPPTPKVVR